MKNSCLASGVSMKQATHMLLFVFFSGDDGKGVYFKFNKAVVLFFCLVFAYNFMEEHTWVEN